MRTLGIYQNSPHAHFVLLIEHMGTQAYKTCATKIKYFQVILRTEFQSNIYSKISSNLLKH